MGHYNLIYYKDSINSYNAYILPLHTIRKINIFYSCSYLAFGRPRKAEQNQVWVGMSKENCSSTWHPPTSFHLASG